MCVIDIIDTSLKQLYCFGLRFIFLFDSKYDALLKTFVCRGTQTGNSGNTVTSLENVKYSFLRI